MSLTSAYSNNYGQLKEFFEKIREGQAPSKFSQEHLKDLGFTSSHHRSYIPIMKALGFLSSDGTPTQTYLEYMDKSKSKVVMAEAIRNAYKPIFLIKANPTKNDKEVIEGKFKSTFNSTDTVAKNRANTFLALLDLADLEAVHPKVKTTPEAKDSDEESYNPKDNSYKGRNVEKFKSDLGLHYNIQIHLPPTKDIEVYNAIFKSIKEHLID